MIVYCNWYQINLQNDVKLFIAQCYGNVIDIWTITFLTDFVSVVVLVFNFYKDMVEWFNISSQTLIMNSTTRASQMWFCDQTE